jgi:ankyrin repeat protein
MADLDYTKILNSPTAFEDTQTLINSGIDINTKDKHNRSLLVKAGFWNRYDIVKLLINHGADLSVTYEEDGSLLIYAIEMRWFDIVDIYLNNPETLKLVINARNYLGQSPISQLLFMYVEDDPLDIIYLEALIQYADLSLKYVPCTLLQLGLSHLNFKVRRLFRDYEALSLIKGAD